MSIWTSVTDSFINRVKTAKRLSTSSPGSLDILIVTIKLSAKLIGLSSTISDIQMEGKICDLQQISHCIVETIQEDSYSGMLTGSCMWSIKRWLLEIMSASGNHCRAGIYLKNTEDTANSCRSLIIHKILANGARSQQTFNRRQIGCYIWNVTWGMIRGGHMQLHSLSNGDIPNDLEWPSNVTSPIANFFKCTTSYNSHCCR